VHFSAKRPTSGAVSRPPHSQFSSDVTLATISGALVRSHPISSPVAQTRRAAPWFGRLSDAAWIRIILATTFLAYLPSINYPFVYDDTPLVLLNPWMNWKNFGTLVSHHMWATASGSGYYPVNFYRPIFMLWLLSWDRISGGVPGFFHLANILLHGITVLLVIEITRRATRNRTISLLAGFLFAFHPIHIEAVVWISGATEVLYTSLVLGSVLTYLLFSEKSYASRRWFALSIVLFALALFAKETAIVLPFAIVAYAWAGSQESTARRLRTSALLLVPYAAVILIYLLVRVRVLGHFAESRMSGPRSAILGFALRFGWYAKQLLWPFHLSVSYPPLLLSRVPRGAIFASLAFFCAVALFTAWKLRRSPGWILIVGLSFFALVPVLLESFTGLQDRYLYLPSFAFCAGLAHLIAKLPSPRMVAAVALGLGLLWSVTIVREERIWDNDLSLFQRAVETAPTPENFAQLSSIYGDAHNYKQQLSVLQSGVQRFPEAMIVWQKLGLFYLQDHQLDSAEKAFTRSQQNANSKPMWGWNECSLGLVSYQRGDLVSAEPKLRAGLAANPSYQECRSTLALLLDRTQRGADALKLRAELP